MSTGRGTSDHSSGERVFGPPLGTYDADWVASAVTAADPAVPAADAQRLAALAWQLLRGGTAPEALPDALGGDATAALVARTALGWVREYRVL